MLLGMHAPDGCNDDMMQGLDDSDLTEISKVPRATAAWQQLGERFRPQSDSQVQYANLYFTRLAKLKERAIKAATDSYGNSDAPTVARIRDLEPGVRSILAATTYKEMRLKPSVIDEIKNDTGVSIKSSVGVPSYASDTDSLMIEDESGRLQLITSEESDLDLTPYFSGVVVGLCGTREKGEKFCVESICFPGLAAQTPPPTLAEDKFVAFVSDLQVGKPGCNPLAGQMLIDYIAGHLGSSQELTFGASIVRVIVAGNSICTLDEEAVRTHEPMNAGQQRSMTDNIRELDTMMTQLCAAVNVDIMPGESDPANQMLPQQPLHRCLLPSTALHDSLQVQQL
jgi:DNA polymerase delta subunit 2